ncbi:hypothetical protein CC86DRAFT_374432 [Ophiobolus disseminans]|uniref:Uncharacterized protein n=1 Tax=Ophiobolus disseminans TaxID=1469910 RepID=A0A6A6ZJ20_9PLEO|nr:hypothetical protein CC86DRAFT_374432 [Ophiobolus disseminans]
MYTRFFALGFNNQFLASSLRRRASTDMNSPLSQAAESHVETLTASHPPPPRLAPAHQVTHIALLEEGLMP